MTQFKCCVAHELSETVISVKNNSNYNTHNKKCNKIQFIKLKLKVFGVERWKKKKRNGKQKENVINSKILNSHRTKI